MTTAQSLRRFRSQQNSDLSAVDAATEAGAAYVWETAYARGRNKGWVEGWAAAFRGETSTRAADVPVALHEAGKGGEEEEEEEEEEEDVPTLELTEECARLFARSAKSQKRQKTVQREPDLNETENFDLGGLAERRRRGDAEKLYGDEARRIAELEADLSASFGQIASETGANYWPVVSLRDGERPGKSPS